MSDHTPTASEKYRSLMDAYAELVSQLGAVTNVIIQIALATGCKIVTEFGVGSDEKLFGKQYPAVTYKLGEMTVWHMTGSKQVHLTVGAYEETHLLRDGMIDPFALEPIAARARAQSESDVSSTILQLEGGAFLFVPVSKSVSETERIMDAIRAQVAGSRWLRR